MTRKPLSVFAVTVAASLITTMAAAQTRSTEHTQRRVGSTLPVQKTIAVTSPAYGADVNGDTKVTFTATGFSKVTVRCWQAGGTIGTDSIAATVDIDDQGNGSFVFPANRYPHGPLMIRLSGSNDQHRDNCYLQVYNTSGKPWNAGLPSAPPPATGMRQVFADDFDQPTLSISKAGEGTTYTSHKPGGGDFSGIPFSDHESGDTTPFSHRDGYLRIRADNAKNTTGLISSVNMAGKGITAKAPCYFECRFIAQSAPGTWPAFWIITNHVGENIRFSDELDVIEAYGGEGKGQPNSNGKYFISTHYWSQGPGGKGKDEKQQGHGQDRVWMYELQEGKGSSWFESFHTYGVYVGLEDTVFYCDNVEVRRHKTARVSKQYPFYFMVNLAIGGASGWKRDLSRYNGIADMYVDYVRVFQGDAK